MFGLHWNIKMKAGMQYELFRLESLLPRRARNTRKKASPAIKPVLSEMTRIRKSITDAVIAFADEAHLSRYIRFHQVALINLINRIELEHQNPKPSKSKHPEPQLKRELMELLAFLNNNYPDYIDQDATPPDDEVDQAAREARGFLTMISNQLQTADVSPDLAPLVLSALTRIATFSQMNKPTYRMLAYAAETRQILSESVGQPFTDKQILQLLIYLNCNSNQVFIFMTDQIDKKLQSFETCADRVEYLVSLLKSFEHSPVKTGVAYLQEAPPLRDQLVSYVRTELEFMERITRGHRRQDAEGDGTAFKIHLQLSVAQLACFFRVLLDTKLIANANTTELLKFIARSSVTKKAEEVSFSSLRTKFYNVESGTMQSVRETLAHIIKHLNPSRFP